jgi:hypothetical protein
MNWLFELALLFRLKDKFWGDWFMRWHEKQIERIVDGIDIAVEDVSFVPSQKDARYVNLTRKWLDAHQISEGEPY